jgi:hypothetical protein
MKDSGATIASVDHMIDKANLLPARDSRHGRGLSHSRLRRQREKVARPLNFPLFIIPEFRKRGSSRLSS